MRKINLIKNKKGYMKKNLLLCVTVFLSTVAFSQTSKDVKKHKFVNSLLAKMTLNEKLCL